VTSILSVIQNFLLKDEIFIKISKLPDEQALQQIRSMHKQILEDADMEIENFKKSLPPRVLKLTFGELKKLQSYDDVDAAIQQTMNDLNMTVKETIQKADEGISELMLYLFMWYIGLHFCLSSISLTLIFHLFLISFYFSISKKISSLHTRRLHYR
jgi:hypothetical protein